MASRGTWPRSGRRAGAAPHSRARRPETPMNAAEERYAGVLELRRKAGEVYQWGFEAIKLRLAEGAWYTPDFLVVLESGGIEIHEFKGHWREAALVRIKVAAALYPCFRFITVQEKKGRTKYAYAFEEIGIPDVECGN